jgi:S1-C subfamily serine protease
MMKRLIDFLFAVAITLALAFILFASGAFATQPTAMEQLRKTAVRIDGTSCLGTGSVVEGKSGKHYILTNQHLCNCARYKGDIYATFEGGALLVGRVVKQDWGSDLCAAQVTSPNPALKLGSGLAPMTELNSRGYPSGRLTESHGIAVGYVDWDTDFPIEEIGSCPKKSSPMYGMNGVLAACKLHYHSLLSNLYARPGASGSPVVNNRGELVAVISSWHTDSVYSAGLVPFEQLRVFMEGL